MKNQENCGKLGGFIWLRKAAGIQKRPMGRARIGRSVTPSGKARYKKAVALAAYPFLLNFIFDYSS